LIKAIREGLSANNISAVYGILNGTCNYILTTMRETGEDFAAVLTAAQEKGYAEADPSFDIDGIDAAHKLCILSALAYGVQPELKTVKISGIRHITAKDISYAQELGYKIKLLGITRRAEKEIMQSVEACLVPAASMLGSVEGVYNGIRIEGDFAGVGLSVGRGAGGGPTASAVVSDIVDLARGHKIPPFGIPAESMKKALWAGTDQVLSRFYMHLQVLDKPGVLADISAIMRDNGLSIEAVIQRGRDPEKPVSIVLTTHAVKRHEMERGAEAIGKLNAIMCKPCLLRIETF
jgi:homoserine dehydrogenase